MTVLHMGSGEAASVERFPDGFFSFPPPPPNQEQLVTVELNISFSCSNLQNWWPSIISKKWTYVILLN